MAWTAQAPNIKIVGAVWRGWGGKKKGRRKEGRPELPLTVRISEFVKARIAHRHPRWGREWTGGSRKHEVGEGGGGGCYDFKEEVSSQPEEKERKNNRIRTVCLLSFFSPRSFSSLVSHLWRRRHASRFVVVVFFLLLFLFFKRGVGFFSSFLFAKFIST